jgi:hypothetical protein
MSLLTSNVVTLADHAKRRDPSGKISKIVEMLSQTNEILQDAHFTEGNLPTGHQTTIRTGLPTVYWRLLNQGVPSSKSTTAQVLESCGILEAWSEVDEDLAALAGDLNAFRLSEATPFVEAMGQEVASTMFYGNSGLAAEEFNGLAVRYSSLSAANAQNIVSAGGAGSDNSSIWLIVWGEDTVNCIFPKGSVAGLEQKDLGLQTVETTSGVGGSRMRAYQEQYKWKTGISVRDWRYAVRIANIDISNLVAKTSAADIFELMIKAMHRIPSLNKGKACFYMNRSIQQMLDIQKRDAVQAGGGLTYENVDGKPVMSFRGIPVRRCDALHELESVVS